MSDGSKLARTGWPPSLIALFGFCFVGAVITAYLRNLPEFEKRDIDILKNFPPKDLGQLILQRDVLLSCAQQYPIFVLWGLCMLYVLMQTFAIPGTLTLSVLAGAIYGVFYGLLAVTLISTLGATCCYCLSYHFGKGIAQALWPSKVEAFGNEVDKRRSDVFNYIVFLRLTPILPNTFINVASPVVRVPLVPFIGTFVGCIPNNFIAVSTGSKLGNLTSLSELYDARQILLGIMLGGVALLPIYMKRKDIDHREKLQQ